MENQATITANKELVEEFINRVFNDTTRELRRITSALT
jgi:hypothetical protein